MWTGISTQAQSPSYGTLQCNREQSAPKIKQKIKKNQREVGSEAQMMYQ